LHHENWATMHVDLPTHVQLRRISDYAHSYYLIELKINASFGITPSSSGNMRDPKVASWYLNAFRLSIYDTRGVYRPFSPLFPSFSLVFRRFPSFSLVFRRFPSFSLVFPCFPLFSLVFPRFPRFRLFSLDFPRSFSSFFSFIDCSTNTENKTPTLRAYKHFPSNETNSISVTSDMDISGSDRPGYNKCVEAEKLQNFSW
jgi:hypothetical protein